MQGNNFYLFENNRSLLLAHYEFEAISHTTDIDVDK
jgi:hypothetical protein